MSIVFPIGKGKTFRFSLSIVAKVCKTLICLTVRHRFCSKFPRKSISAIFLSQSFPSVSLPDNRVYIPSDVNGCAYLFLSVVLCGHLIFVFLSGENQRNAPVFTMFRGNKKAAARYFGRSDLNNFPSSTALPFTNNLLY